MISSEVLVAVLSLLGTAFGSVTGIMAANKLTNYRIAELEKKVDKHNTIIERFALLEQDNKTQWNRIDDLRSSMDEIKKEVLHYENRLD